MNKSMTDNFLACIKNAPNLESIKLPALSAITDVGLDHIRNSPCAKKLKDFCIENIFNRDEVSCSIRTRISLLQCLFTEAALENLLDSFESLTHLQLELPHNLHISVFNRLKTLSSCKLSGFHVEEILLKSISNVRAPCLTVLDLEQHPGMWDIWMISSLLKDIGSNLIEIRLAIKERSNWIFRSHLSLVKHSNGKFGICQKFETSIIKMIAENCPKLRSLTLVDQNQEFSSISISNLLDRCKQISFLHLETKIKWSSECLSVFLSGSVKNLCLQYLCVPYEDLKLNYVECCSGKVTREELMQKAKVNRFPCLKVFVSR